jgi:hypothetical protein
MAAAIIICEQFEQSFFLGLLSPRVAAIGRRRY